MKPKNFKEATKVLQKPEDMTNEECSSLSVWNDGKQCISCWKPSIKERLSILLFGNVWLSVRSGNTQPPVWIDGSKTVFNQPSIKEKVLSIFTKDKRLHTLADLSFLLSSGCGSLGLVLLLVFVPGPQRNIETAGDMVVSNCLILCSLLSAH